MYIYIYIYIYIYTVYLCMMYPTLSHRTPCINNTTNATMTIYDDVIVWRYIEFSVILLCKRGLY